MKIKFNSIIANEKIRKDIFRYSPELSVNKTITRKEKEFLYPIVVDTFKNKTTWATLPFGLTMDQDSCLIKFFKYAEGRRVYDYVFKQTERPYPIRNNPSIPKEQTMSGVVYPFSKNQVISALVIHLKKFNIDFMTIRFTNHGDQSFKSYWDKISEHEKEIE